MLNAITDDPAPRAAIGQASHMLKRYFHLKNRISTNWYKCSLTEAAYRTDMVISMGRLKTIATRVSSIAKHHYIEI
jgi:hypothetical protein